jgi:hypothetical protein
MVATDGQHASDGLTLWRPRKISPFVRNDNRGFRYRSLLDEVFVSFAVFVVQILFARDV